MIINVKKTCQFKTWCKGDKSNIQTNLHISLLRGQWTERTGYPYKPMSRDLIYTAWNPASFDFTMAQMGDINHYSADKEHNRAQISERDALYLQTLLKVPSSKFRSCDPDHPILWVNFLCIGLYVLYSMYAPNTKFLSL